MGLFALQPIAAGERVIEYKGELTNWRHAAVRQRTKAGRTFIFGLTRHWDGLGSASAMWLIADDGDIKQPDGSFLHRRTHALVKGHWTPARMPRSTLTAM